MPASEQVNQDKVEMPKPKPKPVEKTNKVPKKPVRKKWGFRNAFHGNSNDEMAKKKAKNKH